MSHHSEDAFLANSDSFWEPGNYKRTTRRIEDGNRLCSDLVALIMDRAEIEKAYAKSLKSFAAKWNAIIEKGPEYGTSEAAWKAVLVEADRRADVHSGVKEALNLRVANLVKSWQKENYHKAMMQLKEKKEMDEAFKKAQKPWAKLLQKVNKSKAEFHAACKAEKTAITQERNASGDSTLSNDQKRKLEDRVQKSKDQVLKCRENYEGALQDINNYNAKYMEDMTEVFERCQQFEAQRLQCFKDVVFKMQECLNIAEDVTLPQIYEEFRHTVNNADHEKDLRWWSNTHGVNMAMNWPQFEDYAEEFRDIAGKSTKKNGGASITEGNITLIHQRSVGDDLPEKTPSASQNGRQSNNNSNNGNAMSNKGGNVVTSKATNKTEHDVRGLEVYDMELYDHSSVVVDNIGKNVGNKGFHPIDLESPARALPRPNRHHNGSKDANPFDEEEWDDHDPLVDNGEPGVRVKALYDYEAAEDDELYLKTGDVFEKLEDEDEQGWCKGRKDGRVGLYPANYVEVIE